MSSMEAAEGCQWVDVLSNKNPAKVIVAEFWQCEALHDADAKKERSRIDAEPGGVFSGTTARGDVQQRLICPA